MAGRVQRVPRGLLAFLDARGTGENPNTLGDVVSVTIEGAPFYLSDQLTSEQDVTIGATNVNDLAFIDVPAGEVWRIVSLGCFLDTFSAVYSGPLSVLIQLLSPGAPFGVEVGALNMAAAPVGAAGDQIGFAAIIPEPLVVPSGTRLQAVLNTDLGAVTMDLVVRALFQRLLA